MKTSPRSGVPGKISEITIGIPDPLHTSDDILYAGGHNLFGIISSDWLPIGLI